MDMSDYTEELAEQSSTLVTCHDCKGAGRGVHPKAGEWLCSTCHGSGKVPFDHWSLRPEPWWEKSKDD